MPERTFIHRGTKAMTSFRSLGQDNNLGCGQYHRLQIKILWSGTISTPGSPRISVSTHYQYMIGALRSHEWFSSSSKMPSWIAIAQRITHLSVLPIVCNGPGNLFSFLFFLLLFFPPNSICLIQPMDQGVIVAFKADCLRKNLCPGYCCNWGKHWEDIAAILEGLQHLWPHP